MSTSSASSTAAVSTLTPQELSRLLLAPHMTPPVSRTFENHPTSTATLRYYTFLSQSIVTLEEELERHQLEREKIFNHLMRSRMFRQKMQPLVTNYRPTAPRRTRFHPYSYPSPSPSPDRYSPLSSPLNGSVNSFQSVKIQSEGVLPRNSTPSVTTSVPNSMGSFQYPDEDEPGLKENPIVVHEDENVCTRCKQQGHQQEDCSTPLRSFQHCEVCAWTRTKQELCTHIDISPAWLKKLKANIEKKNN
jgi:hypothetical protein